MKITHCLAFACVVSFANADKSTPVVTERNLSVAAFIDVGQVVQGTYVNDDGLDPKTLHDIFMNRDGIALTYSGTLNGNVHMNIGVGGLFWKPFLTTDNASTKKINFGPGISEASTQYDYNPRLTVKFGYFGYKYNPDAINLGEYLLRSEAYPTILQNGTVGDWVWLGNEYKSMGTKVTWDLLGGALRQDFLLFSDFYASPLFDFSPSYVATWKVNKAFEIGGGFSLHRWLPIKPSETTPHQANNTYVEIPNFPALSDPADAILGFKGGTTMKGIESQIDNFADPVGNHIVKQDVDAQGRTIFIVNDMGNPTDDTLRPTTETNLTFKAIEVMGRASLNLSTLFGLEEKTTGPFKLFGEIAVLGLENQPYFYEDRTQRMPIMLGADIPTFNWLDLFSVQVEYLKNPFPDNNYAQFNSTVPQPQLPSDNPAIYKLREQQGVYNHDDFKWSIVSHISSL